MKNALKKVYSVLYWRLYGVVSKALLLGAKLYAGLFVAQAERKYWLMNAARVIRNRRDTTERKTFEQLLAFVKFVDYAASVSGGVKIIDRRLKL